MKVAAKPSNEAERLQALKNYRILDTLPELAFDDFTLLASQICEAPIALVTFVDAERQWFKSRSGLAIHETSRDVAFCSHAILEDNFFEVPDALNDDRFFDNPLVVGSPNIRFYAGAPLQSPTGENVGTLCVLDLVPRELTEEQKAALRALGRQIIRLLEMRAQNETILRAAQLLKSSPSAITCKDYQDMRGEFVDWNEAAEEIFGVKKEDILGKTDFDLFPDSVAKDNYQKDLETLHTAQMVHIPHEIVETKMGKLDLQTWKVPVEGNNGIPRYLLGISIDITKQKELERQILEEKKKAERAAETKASFLANISHELRTPMNGIIGMSNLLLGSVTNSDHMEKLKIIQSCSHNLLDIINDVLDFSKLEVDKVQVEKIAFPVKQTVKELVDLLTPRASEKGVSLSFSAHEDMPDWVIGDVTRFRQVLTNLVSNALKFTLKGSVEINCRASKISSDDWRLEFSVKDTGIGIPNDVKDKLFLPFSQVDASTNRRFGGSGLGLAICKGLCEKMGGKIWFESAPQLGSIFNFTINVGVSEEMGMHKKQSSSRAIDHEMGQKLPLKILVADDNRTNQLVVLGFLGKIGYTADVAFNGNEVFSLIQNKSYDLILMDCFMPELNGFETTKLINDSLPAERRPRIIALSASSLEEDIARCFEAGMDGFLSKPLKLEALIDELELCHSRLGQEKKAPPKTEIEDNVLAFDRVQFLEVYSELGEDVINDLVTTFLENLSPVLEKIQHGINSNIPKEVELSAHSLRGSALNFFAQDVAEQAAKLELRARAGDLSQAAEQFALLNSKIKKLIVDLRTLKAS